MPEQAPKGIHPIYLRPTTLEKFGLKTGENVNDLVEYKNIPKADIMKEIQVAGVMCDFEPAKKNIESYHGDQIMIIIDLTQKYGETCLICYTDEAKDEYLREINERQEAIQAQLLAEQEAEAAKKAAEEARLNVVYEDKPRDVHPWNSQTIEETMGEIKLLAPDPVRELISIEVIRPKKFTRQPYRFTNRNADVGGVAEFRAYKDPNFRQIREMDKGIQVAPTSTDAAAQTTWNRAVNKAVQYESAGISTEISENNDSMLSFLEKATFRIEQALQQNESVDIFNDTFRIVANDDDANDSALRTENELREVKNFADANHSKSKALAAIDWMPRAQGMVAVTAVKNISFDQRIPILGQTQTSYIMLWDFRLLVKPLILMQSPQEIFTFRFNRTQPGLVAGGCITGQVILWEVNEAVNIALRKNNRGSANTSSNVNNNKSSTGAGGGSSNTANFFQDDDEEQLLGAVTPKYISSIDYSHKKCVADLFWLPPSTQINYRGQLVKEEHLDGQSHQFVTVAGDGMVMIWDTRYERIFNDELRFIGRPKHVPTEKASTKDGGTVRPVWAPIFKAHLKRLEGVGELSLCRVCETNNTQNVAKNNQTAVNANYNNKAILNSAVTSTTYPGDPRAQFLIATEEGDIVFADLAARKNETATLKEEEEEDESEFSCVKWISADHSRPAVHLQESPFYPQIVLTVSDWNFHIWKLGESQPLFSSPLSSSYLTAGAWSTTRPSVLFVACADGQIHAWDFTDSSFRPAFEMKATHAKITSMEILINSNSSTAAAAAANTSASNNNANSASTSGGNNTNSNAAANANNPATTANKYHLLAVGDESGTLHIFELPRALTKPVHKEDLIMLKFLERELQRVELDKANKESRSFIGIERIQAAAEAQAAALAAAANNPANTAVGRPASSYDDKPKTSTSTSNNANMNGTSNSANAPIPGDTVVDEVTRVTLAALQKEEEDFLKLEAMFMSELGIDQATLPPAPPITKV